MKALLLLTAITFFSLSCSKGGGKSATAFKNVLQKVLMSEPTTLNPFSSSDTYSTEVQGYVLETLMDRNVDTYGWDPAIAESFEMDKDGMGVTFTIRKGITWHDGKPLTLEDVKFSFDAIMDDRFKAGRIRPYYENIKGAEVKGENKIYFGFKEKYFGNFNVVAGLTVVPKHVYGDPEKKTNKILVGSGPFQMDRYDKSKSILLKKNANWWGKNVASYNQQYRFDGVLFRFIKEYNIQLENFKKGKIDVLALTPEQYMKKTDGKGWGDRYVKNQVENLAPKGYGFVGWNFKNPIFQSKKTRQALAHLMNRPLMIERFKYGMAMEATGPWYRQSPYADPSVKPFSYNPDQARKLLAEDGWSDTDKNGVLEKSIAGQKTEFKFQIMMSTREWEKYLTIYKEDLKKAGIDAALKVVEWNTFVASMEDNLTKKEKTFDALVLGWGAGSVDNDPKQIWHSESTRPGGSNFIQYVNKDVDKLIDAGRKELDRNKRIEAYKKIFRTIADEAPYVFMFNNKYTLYANSGRVKKDKDTRQYALGVDYWTINQNP